MSGLATLSEKSPIRRRGRPEIINRAKVAHEDAVGVGAFHQFEEALFAGLLDAWGREHDGSARRALADQRDRILVAPDILKIREDGLDSAAQRGFDLRNRTAENGQSGPGHRAHVSRLGHRHAVGQRSRRRGRSASRPARGLRIQRRHPRAAQPVQLAQRNHDIAFEFISQLAQFVRRVAESTQLPAQDLIGQRPVLRGLQWNR